MQIALRPLKTVHDGLIMQQNCLGSSSQGIRGSDMTNSDGTLRLMVQCQMKLYDHPAIKKMQRV